VPDYAVMCAVKDEAPYIFEHYAWYKALGFSRFIYAHNDCTDQTPQVLSTLAGFDPRVRTFHNLVEEGESPQHSAYLQARKNILPDLPGWYVLVIDIDEFLLLKAHEAIGDLMRAYDFPEAMSFNWRVFGSNGHDDFSDDLVINRFTACSLETFKMNRQRKTMWRNTALCEDNTSHLARFRKGIRDTVRWISPADPPAGVSVPPEFRVTPATHIKTSNYGPFLGQAQLNHYVLKSRAEYELKSRRGRGSQKRGGPRKGTRHTAEFFTEWDRNDLVDRSATRHAGAVSSDVAALKRRFLGEHRCPVAFGGIPA